MVINLCVTPEREIKTRRIMEALERGMNGAGKVITGMPPEGEPFIAWGHLWCGGAAVARAMNDGTPFWFVDNGFWKSAKGEAVGFYSITWRSVGPSFIEGCNPERNRVNMLPWRDKRDGYVLIALPGENHGAGLGWNMREWGASIADRVRAVTDRKIRVRKKGSRIPLDDDLAGARVLVTHSSKVAVDAVLRGVPCVVDPASPAAPVSRTDMSQIEDLAFPERSHWWASLMAQQFTIGEMASGLAWGLMRKNAGWQ